jgi:hypothetical protein
MSYTNFIAKNYQNTNYGNLLIGARVPQCVLTNVSTPVAAPVWKMLEIVSQDW